MENNLAVILSGCKQGVPAWQRILYEKYYGFVFSISFRYGASREDANEILNDSFVKVFRGIVTFEFPDQEHALAAGFMSWLKKIVIHTGINHCKSKANHFDWLQHEEAVEGPVEYNHDEPIQKMSYEELMKLIQRLSPAYRSVFSLFVLDGHSHKEIANLTGISEGASKSNLLKARKQLRKMLQLIQAQERSNYE